MSLDEIIKLFQEVEAGVEGQVIGYHLHSFDSSAIADWLPQQRFRYPPTFSGFLTALKEAEAK